MNERFFLVTPNLIAGFGVLIALVITGSWRYALASIIMLLMCANALFWDAVFAAKHFKERMLQLWLHL